MKKLATTTLALAALLSSATVANAKQDVSALYGEWNVEKIDGKTNDNKDMLVGFNIKEHRLYGNTGCNTYFGSIQTATSKGKLNFGGMGATRMYCHDVTNEQDLFTALAGVQFFKLDKAKTTAELKDKKGNVLLVLTKKD